MIHLQQQQQQQTTTTTTTTTEFCAVGPSCDKFCDQFPGAFRQVLHQLQVLQGLFQSLSEF